MVREAGKTCSNCMYKFRSNKDIHKKWFTSRVVDEWNMLDSHKVSAYTMHTFKSRLDKFIDCEVRSLTDSFNCRV